MKNKSRTTMFNANAFAQLKPSVDVSISIVRYRVEIRRWACKINGKSQFAS